MSMFIAALFSVTKVWKHPKCPTIGKQIKKMWYRYTMEYYLAIKKKEILPFAMTQVELESVMLSKISQRQIPYDLTHMWNLRNKTNEWRKRGGQTKKQTPNYREQTDGYQPWGGRGKRGNETGDGNQKIH